MRSLIFGLGDRPEDRRLAPDRLLSEAEMLRRAPGKQCGSRIAVVFLVAFLVEHRFPDPEDR